MTDTTDIKALREQAEKAKVCGGIFAISGEQALSLLDQLEAERQRADNASFRENHLNDMLNDKIQQNVDLRAELAALKGELANPVVLEYRKHDGFTDPEKVRLINAVTDRCAAAIKESGFTVKEGQ